MGHQTVYRNEKKNTVNVSFSVSNNIAFFEAKNDNDIFIFSNLVNIASIVITYSGVDKIIYSNGSFINLPYVLIRSNTYKITITKIDVNLDASLSFITRYSANTTTTINALDVDVNFTKSYFLLTNQQVAVVPKNNMLYSNYAGSGSWINGFIETTLTLPTVTNNSWKKVSHILFGGVNYACVIGTNSVNQTLNVCLIRPSDNKVFNLDLVENSTTNITANTTAGYFTSGIIAVQENPISNKIMIVELGTVTYCEIDLLTRKFYHNFPYNAVQNNVDRKGFYNVIDNLYTSVKGCFSILSSPNTLNASLEATSYYTYDSKRNAKLGYSNYRRITGFDKNGLSIYVVGGSDIIFDCKDSLCKNDYLYSVTATGVLMQNMISNTYANITINASIKNWTSIIDKNYCHENGSGIYLLTNTTRLYFCYVNKDTLIYTEAYYDFSSAAISDCNDRIQISL